MLSDRFPRRRRLLIAAALLLAAVGASGAARPPNLILLLSDDQGFDLGAFGSPQYVTPHLDRMAAEGMRGTNFYVTASVCTPSRSGLITGRYPQRNGTYEMIRNDMVSYGHRYSKSEYAISPEMTLGLDPREITFGDVLRSAGYATGVIGKWGTFLGVLAASGIRMNPDDGECEKQAIELRNANERLIELLENLGVLHLFKTCNGQLPDCERIESSPCHASRVELTQASLEAHQTLMEINPANVARFKDVAKFLAEDLAKLKLDGPKS